MEAKKFGKKILRERMKHEDMLGCVTFFIGVPDTEMNEKELRWALRLCIRDIHQSLSSERNL